MATMQLHIEIHDDVERIFIAFAYNADINNIIKQITGIKWSQRKKQWHLRVDKAAVKLLAEKIKPHAKLDVGILRQQLLHRKQMAPTIKKSVARLDNLCDENQAALNVFIQTLQLKAYSKSTITTYRNEFMQLLQLLKNKQVNKLTPDDLKRYIVNAMKNGLSENGVHSRMNAIKFYFEQVLNREKFFWEIPRPKKQLQLPRFFNQDEITAIIKATGNIKHKTMLMLAYSSGLRVSEVINIKTKDIDSKRMCILIRQSKGKKDRMVALSPVLLIMLREYWIKCKPSKAGYLFAGQYKDEPYSLPISG